MRFIKKFIHDNKKFVVTIAIYMLGQALLYWLLKSFQTNPIYINYYLDDKIPFIGQFVYIYDIFYPFCFIALYFLYKKEEETYYKGIIAGCIGYIICDIIFLTIPTIMYRPVIPSVDPLTDLVLKITFIYDNPPLNCFPSIHCLFCFQVIYSYLRSKYSLKNKIIVSIISLLIIASTLLIKQHYFYDVISAFLICLATNLIVEAFPIYNKLKKYINKI